MIKEYHDEIQVSHEIDWERFGKQIRHFRTMRKLRQKDLAEKIHAKPNTISRLEIGAIGCSLETLLALCEALEVSPDSLLVGNYTFAYSPMYQQFYDMKDDLSSEIASSIREIFENMPQPKDAVSRNLTENIRNSRRQLTRAAAVKK